MRAVYQCSYCFRQFENYNQCMTHEEKHRQFHLDEVVSLEFGEPGSMPTIIKYKRDNAIYSYVLMKKEQST